MRTKLFLSFALIFFTCGLLGGCQNPVAKEAKANSPQPLFQPPAKAEKPPTPPETHSAQGSTSAQETSLDFLDFVASHCLADKLGQTEYTRGWETWLEGKGRRFIPQYAPQPIRTPFPIPAPGSRRAKKRASKLKKEWSQNPRSHVVDCKFPIPPRRCPGCRGRGAEKAYYTAYLPKDLFTNPERVRSILILIPGGNGGRVRYFLTPIPRKTIYQKMSGGLETKRHVDEYLENHPETSPPIVVALDGAGFLMVNGPTEFLTHDVPTHIAQTYLGRSNLHGIAVGAEGISSGSKATMKAMLSKPDAFHTLGLTCMHCRRFNGIDPDKDLGTPKERTAWLSTLSQRAQRNELHVRFSIGNLDNQWPCNKEFHELFANAGVLQSTDPEYTSCRRRRKPDTKHCDTTWDGFYLYDGQAHHYGLLLDSWVPQLQWHVETLSQTAQTLNTP